VAAATTTKVLGFPVTVPTIGAYASLISVSAVPEPESFAMLIIGLGLIGATVNRRKINQA
jgi:phosphoribosylcarboxyaminoimidazole (NCAIR) mutase